jgi:hypothetical protein
MILLPSNPLPVLALLLAAQGASAQSLVVNIEIPRLDVPEYRRPYVAVWLEREDRTVASHLAVWYQQEANGRGTHWLPDLRQWWRRGGREQTMPLDGVTGASRPAGLYSLQFATDRAPFLGLTAGSYVLVVEAVREEGGREVLRLPLIWPQNGPSRETAKGATELGEVSVTFAP